MDYIHFQEVVSYPRFERFIKATSGDQAKALSIYKSNLCLSQRLFGVMSIFEIALRNAIDKHYQTKFGRQWLLSQANIGGFFWTKGCEKTRTNLLDVIGKLGTGASNDSIVAALNFGFWRYLFNSKEFSAGGSTLLKIFPLRPLGKNHTDVFNTLSSINLIRNRVAHHEPICFSSAKSVIVSEFYAKQVYNEILEVLIWLNYDRSILLTGVDFVENEMTFLKSLK